MRDHVQANKLKHATRLGYGAVVRRHLVPAFGGLPIDQVGAAEIQALKASIANFKPAHLHDFGPRVLYHQDKRGAWQPIKPWLLRKLLHAAQERAGLPLTGMHRLRHSFCSMLGELGTPGPEIQALAGHANLTTTEVYLHLSPNATRSAIARIDHANGEIVEEESAKPKKRRNRKK